MTKVSRTLQVSLKGDLEGLIYHGLCLSPLKGEPERVFFTTMNGKLTCKMLKSVRKQIADANNIDYEPRVCHFEGNCRGTCPACEAEMRYLESQLSLRQAAGKVIKIVGLATGISAAMASCTSQPSDVPNNSVPEITPTDTVAKKDSSATTRDSVCGPVMDSAFLDPNYKPSYTFDPSDPSAFFSPEEKSECIIDEGAVRYPSVFIPSLKQKTPIDDDEFMGDIREIPSFPNLKSDLDEGLEENTIYVPHSEKAHYPGGPTALADFLRKNLVYPKSAIESHTEGTVIVDFCIEKNGGVSDVKVVQSVNYDLDKEAKRVVKLMNNWIPAEFGTRKVRSRYRLPIDFKL